MIAEIEPLETRRLFAKLSFIATAHSDNVALDIKTTRIWYTLNGVTQKFHSNGVAVVVIQLGNGNDKLILGAFAPPVYVDCGIGNDTVAGGSGLSPETLLGGNGNDSLTGGFSQDRIDGGYGDDILTGGLGADTLIGGYGADTLNAIDNEPDSVDGGPNTDSAHIDINDIFENIELRYYS